MGKTVTEVVAALIWDGNRFLICQRPAQKARGLLWEFAGGKVEPGETKEQALIRECLEELAVMLSVGGVFTEVDHDYPDLTVHLTLFNASIREGTPQMLEHNDIRWITLEDTQQYEFCPADEVILKKLRGGNAAPREEGVTMEPVYYTVDFIDGDYAHMTSDNGVENQVAMFLLPEGTTVGSRLVREILEWSLV